MIMTLGGGGRAHSKPLNQINKLQLIRGGEEKGAH